MRLTLKSSSVPSARWHRHVSRPWAAFGVAAALALIFSLDRSTGSSPFQHLYYLPIIFASAQFGYGGSLLVSATAVVLYHLANPYLLSFRYEERDVVQVALFILVGLVAARFADDARKLHRLATTDDLTGLHNLRSFESHLRGFIVAAALNATPLALVALDVDRLKSLNDVHGHLTGAEAVKTVGQLIADRLVNGAVGCRYGGDEFVIALPGVGEDDAIAFANELREAVHACAPVLDGTPFPAGTLSISVGIASRSRRVHDQAAAGDHAEVAGEALFRAADAALYAAKRAGRNRISSSHSAA